MNLDEILLEYRTKIYTWYFNNFNVKYDENEIKKLKEYYRGLSNSLKDEPFFIKRITYIKSMKSMYSDLIMLFKKIGYENFSERDIYDFGEDLLILGRESDALTFYLDALEHRPNLRVNLSIGDMYYYGIGTKKNYEIAREYFIKAMDNNEKYYSGINEMQGSYYRCAKDYYKKKDYAKAVNALSIASKYGSIKANNQLGYMYQIGDGVKKSDLKAAMCFSEAVTQGKKDLKYRLNLNMIEKKDIAVAFNNLGYMNIDKNNEYALNCFFEAAKLGLNSGYYHLGYMYEFGLGTEKNIDEAIKYYTIALEKDYPLAKEGLDRLKMSK